LRLTCGNNRLDSILFVKPQTVLIYGEEGAGKTNFALTILKLSEYERAIYISTEGSSYLERAYQLSLLDKPNLLLAEALDTQHLVELIASVPVIGFTDLIIIDSINFHYRAEASAMNSLRQFLALLTILRNYVRCGTHVIAIAQVREEAEAIEPAGMQYLKPWADIIARICAHESCRVIRVEKPITLEERFEIGDEGITWISTGGAREATDT